MRFGGPKAAISRTGPARVGWRRAAAAGLALLPWSLSRFGIVGVLVLLLGYCALTRSGGGGMLGGRRRRPGKRRLETRSGDRKFSSGAWIHRASLGRNVPEAGAEYPPTTLVAYTDYNQSGCGAAQAAMGPFYCPNDKKIYVDPAFFNELSQRFGAPGDFARPMSSPMRSGTISRTWRERSTGRTRRRRGPARQAATPSRSGSNSRPTAMPACGRQRPRRKGFDHRAGRP